MLPGRGRLPRDFEITPGSWRGTRPICRTCARRMQQNRNSDASAEAHKKQSPGILRASLYGIHLERKRKA